MIIEHTSKGIDFKDELLIDKHKEIINAYKFEGETESEMIDRFTIQFLEEIQEYEESSNKADKTEELADCIFYVCSMLATLEEHYGVVRDKAVSKFKTSFSQYMPDNFSLVEYVNKEFLWNIRRNYPERKYHKSSETTLSLIDIQERSKYTYTIIYNIFKLLSVEVMKSHIVTTDASSTEKIDEIFTSKLNRNLRIAKLYSDKINGIETTN